MTYGFIRVFDLMMLFEIGIFERISHLLKVDSNNRKFVVGSMEDETKRRSDMIAFFFFLSYEFVKFRKLRE